MEICKFAHFIIEIRLISKFHFPGHKSKGENGNFLYINDKQLRIF